MAISHTHLCTYLLFLHNIKEKIIGYANFTLNRKTSLIFILIFTGLAVFDSTIVEFSSYSGVEASTSVNTAIFIIFSIIFVASSTILLNSVRKSTYDSKSPPLGLGYFHGIMSGTQILTVMIIVVIIFQMLLLNEYNLVLLKVQTYLSHLSALVFLSFLVFLFSQLVNFKKKLYNHSIFYILIAPLSQPCGVAHLS